MNWILSDERILLSIFVGIFLSLKIKTWCMQIKIGSSALRDCLKQIDCRSHELFFRMTIFHRCFCFEHSSTTLRETCRWRESERKKTTISINQMRNDQFQAAKKKQITNNNIKIVASRETKKNDSKIVWRSIGVALKCHFRFFLSLHTVFRWVFLIWCSSRRMKNVTHITNKFVAFWRHKRNFSVDFECAILHSFIQFAVDGLHRWTMKTKECTRLL